MNLDVLVNLAAYAGRAQTLSRRELDTARFCLMDSLACGFQALDDPACANLLGTVVPGASLAGGARVPGTSLELDPVMAAFNTAVLSGWLDLNDTGLKTEWGHPADNLGGILAVADYLSRQRRLLAEPPLTVRDVLVAMTNAHDIQRELAKESRRDVGATGRIRSVRAATSAVVTQMLGGDRDTVLNAVSNAWIEGCPGSAGGVTPPGNGLRHCRTVADATSRGVHLALMAMAGETGQSKDGARAARLDVNASMNHRERRTVCNPGLKKKFAASLAPKLADKQFRRLDTLCADFDTLAVTAVDDFMALLVI